MKKFISLIYLLISASVYGQTLTGVAISPLGVSLQTGATYQFSVTCTYSDASTDDCTKAGGATWVASTSGYTMSGSGLVTAVADPGAGLTKGGLAVVTAGGISDRAAMLIQHPGDFWVQYPTPNYRTYKQTILGTLLPLYVAVGSSVAIGSGITVNATGAGLTGTSYSPCNWASSNTAVATVSRYGLVTAVGPGSVDITCGILGNAVFNSSSQAGWISPGNVITLTVVNGGTGTTTWYVRPDGGTPYVNGTDTPVGQCDGKHDAAYPGTGVNQPCAMGNLRFLWTDMTTRNQMQWMITGGDTVIVRQNSSGYNMGADANTGSNPINCGGDTGDCYMPTVPSGTTVQHTRILGENYASCTADSAKTLLHGTYFEYGGFNTTDSQFVDIACFEYTDTATCGGNGNFINTCPSGSNVGSNGVLQSALTGSVAYTDLFIHGLASDGIRGASGVGDVANFVHLRAMPDAGINMDDDPWGQGNISAAGGWTMNNSLTEFTGCVEIYPVVLNYPYIECRDQNAGGYADGFGTSAATGDWHFDHDLWRYNYQDGLDLLHSGLNSLEVTNSKSYGNDGQQFKIGSGKLVEFINNLTLNNCARIGTLFGDEPASVLAPAPTNQHTNTGLTLTYTSGVMVSGPGVFTTTAIPGATFTLTANSTNYIWVDPATFTLQQNATGFPTGLNSHYRVAAPVTNGTGIISGQYNEISTQISLCRANGDGIGINFDNQGTDIFEHNTYVGYGDTSYDMGCSGWDSCVGTNSIYIDNINIGIINTNYNTSRAPGLFFAEEPLPPNLGWATREYNQYYNFRNGTPCPSTLNTGELCSNALFVNQPPLTISSELTLDDYNFNLTSASPAKFAGIVISGLTTDRNGNPYASPPSMGPLEFFTSPPTLHLMFGGGVKLSGSVKF